MKKHYTVEELADYLVFKPSTIIRWCKKNYLPYVKLNKKYYFSKTTIYKWIESKKVNAK